MVNLVCHGLCLSRGGQRVLNDLSFTFERGKLVGLIGPNGSGKSTLLRTLYGYLSPEAGWVELGSKKVGDWSPSELACQLGVCPQEPEPTLDFQVQQVLALRFGGDLEKLGEALRPLHFLGLEALSHQRLSELSGGERQRVRLAMALVSQAPWLLLDEPANHLDLATGWALFDYLAEYGRSGGVVVALHDLQTAVRHCETLVALKEGKLIRAGSPEEVLTPDLLAQVFGLRGQVRREGERILLELEGIVVAGE